MRRRYILIAFFAIAGVMQAAAQELHIREVFKAMPDSVLPYITANNRLDFIDFIDSHMEANVTNALGGQSQMEQLTDHYLRIKLSPASTVELRLLPVGELVDSASQIICMVQTYGTVAKESRVTFYTTRWHQLDGSQYFSVQPQSLLHRPATVPVERYQELCAALTPLMMVAHLSADGNTMDITLSNHIPVEQDREEAKAIILQTTLKWNGKMFNKN